MLLPRHLQAAFATMTKSLQCEWGFIQRVVPDCSDEFMELQDTIKECFLPALFYVSLSEAELQFFALPTCLADRSTCPYIYAYIFAMSIIWMHSMRPDRCTVKFKRIYTGQAWGPF